MLHQYDGFKSKRLFCHRSCSVSLCIWNVLMQRQNESSSHPICKTFTCCYPLLHTPFNKQLLCLSLSHRTVKADQLVTVRWWCGANTRKHDRKWSFLLLLIYMFIVRHGRLWQWHELQIMWYSALGSVHNIDYKERRSNSYGRKGSNIKTNQWQEILNTGVYIWCALECNEAFPYVIMNYWNKWSFEWGACYLASK